MNDPLNTSLIERDQHDNLCVLTLASPPVNALGGVLRGLLLGHLQAAFADKSVEAIVITSALPLFCGGADIQEFKSRELWQSPDLPSLCHLLDNAPKPVVAGINGIAMGGAVEMALCCDYRVGRVSATLGLPEVKLGLLPGAGGTQRLPRVANLTLATEMILSGNPVSAQRAHDAGLLDELVSSEVEFLPAVLDFTRRQLKQGTQLRHCSDISVDMTDIDPAFFAQQAQALAAKTRGQVAPLRCLQSIEAACSMPLTEGLAQERAGFLELLSTSQSRGMIHLFFAERGAQKIPGITVDTAVRSINSTAVLGAGTMGTGIAIAFADAGLPVLLLDLSDGDVSAGLSRINQHYQRQVSKGRLSESEAQLRMSTISGTLDFADLSDTDLVIEAVFENMDIKKAVFEQLDKVCKGGAILASNTSTLDLNRLAAVTSRPGDVVGMHFFSPANIMKLLEIVRGEHTAPEVIKTVIALAKRIAKVPVVVNVCFGFVGNRMLEPYFREASRMMLEGATAEQIDRVLTDFGMAMGVISMGDLAGIDVGYLVREGCREMFVQDPTYQAIQDKLYELGRYGQKTGRGCYQYNGREKFIDAETDELCKELATALGVRRRQISDTEILERCLYPLINEGFVILQEHIAYRSSDCDVIWVNGYGFPAWRGGPMQYANEIGLDKILNGIDKYRDQLGDYGKLWFVPADLLIDLVEQEKQRKHGN